MATIGSLFVSIGFTTDELEKGAAKAGKTLKTFSKNGALALGAVGAAGVAMGAAIGKAALDVSRDLDNLERDFQATLGVNETAAKNFADGVGRVWSENFGDDIADVGDTWEQVVKQLGMVDDVDAIEAATTNVHRLTDAFGDLEKDETLNAVNALMENFGLTSTEAFDFITTGMQKGLNASDDFLDTIGEYSNQFATAGLDADNFFAIMETGMQSGVLGTDKIADAVKEFNILWTEGDDDLKATLDTLYGVEGVYDQLVADGADMDRVMESVLGRLRTIEDVNQRAMMERSLFGTMAEDLGPGFTQDLRMVTTELESMVGATESLDVQYQNFGDMFQGIWRKVVMAIVPVTDELFKIAQDAMPYVMEFFEKAEPIINDFATTMVDTLGKALPSIGDSLYRIGAALGIGDENASGMDMALSILTGTLDLIVTSVEAFTILMYGLASAVEYAVTAFGKLNDRAGSAAGAFENAATIGGAALTDPGALAFAIGKELGFAQGGVVPGAIGQPVMVMAHGGERITPPGQASAGANIYIDGIHVGGGDSVQDALQEAFNIISQKIAQTNAA